MGAVKELDEMLAQEDEEAEQGAACTARDEDDDTAILRTLLVIPGQTKGDVPGEISRFRYGLRLFSRHLAA